MSKAIGGLFGGGAMKQQQQAMAEQQRLVAEERRRVEAVEQGQLKARNAGRGLLAFVDSEELAATLGGGPGSMFQGARAR